jgi:hypothetical protein
VGSGQRCRRYVDDHAIHVREQWWREAIGARGLPGAPPVGPTLTRAEVWAPADDVFTLLWHDNRSAIRSPGPSFLTKFLYFAGGGDPDHPCLILDRVVANALHDHCGWDTLDPAGPWPAHTYQRYCDLPARWARERHRAPDEIERALFAGAPEDRS